MLLPLLVLFLVPEANPAPSTVKNTSELQFQQYPEPFGVSHAL